MSRSLLIFYLLVIYVLLSFLWWAYLMFDFNRSVYKMRKQVVQMQKIPEKTTQHQLEQFQNEYQGRKWMIIGEGSVFFILLLVGAYMLHRSFRKELFLNRQQKNFILSVTHELKSPLSSIKLVLQTLQKHKLKKEQRNELVEESISDVERLRGLVDNVLFVTRFEEQGDQYDMTTFDLSELVRQATQRLSGNERKIKVDADQGVKIEGDQWALGAVVENLLNNALKYSEDMVKVQLEQGDSRVRLRVIDQGKGIPEQEKQHIFKRFYRVGDEETRQTKGTGLGLYIVEQVVKAHQGDVSVYDNQPKGTIFEVTLPSKTRA